MKLMKNIMAFLMGVLLVSTCTVQASPPPNPGEFVLQFGGTLATDTPTMQYPQSQNSVYSVSGTTCSSEYNNGIKYPIVGDKSWKDIERSLSDSAGYIKKSPLTGKHNGVLYLKARIFDGALEDGWIQFIIVLKETSRNDETGKITFTGTWQTLSCTGGCEGWQGTGTVIASGTFAKSPNDYNPTGFSFPQNGAYSEFVEGLRLRGNMTKVVVPE